MSAGGGRKAVIAALLANSGIAVAKFVAFLITGASSMLAESVHSVADAGNQGLLLLGGARGKRSADREHPFGYGRERYFWAFVVALVLFALGSLFALYEGLHKLQHPSDVDAPQVAIVVLVVAIVLEILSFRTAIHEARAVMGDEGWWEFIRHTRSPELPVVLLEDAGALFGLVLALGGVLLAAATGDPMWDAIGTLCIAALLGVIAVVLVVEMKSLLIGEGAVDTDVASIEAALTSGEEVSRVIHLKTLYLGPDELLVAAKIELSRATSLDEVSAAINATETRLRAAVPAARVIYLEPDVFRTKT